MFDFVKNRIKSIHRFYKHLSLRVRAMCLATQVESPEKWEHYQKSLTRALVIIGGVIGFIIIVGEWSLSISNTFVRVSYGCFFILSTAPMTFLWFTVTDGLGCAYILSRLHSTSMLAEIKKFYKMDDASLSAKISDEMIQDLEKGEIRGLVSVEELLRNDEKIIQEKLIRIHTIAAGGDMNGVDDSLTRRIIPRAQISERAKNFIQQTIPSILYLYSERDKRLHEDIILAQNLYADLSSYFNQDVIPIIIAYAQDASGVNTINPIEDEKKAGTNIVQMGEIVKEFRSQEAYLNSVKAVKKLK